jgi:hypothetical protein
MFCLQRVNLPLLHRLPAGMAKVKIAGKKIRRSHRYLSLVPNDYNNNPRALASFFPPPRRARVKRGCGAHVTTWPACLGLMAPNSFDTVQP